MKQKSASLADFLFCGNQADLGSSARNHRVRKYAATKVRRFKARKKPIITRLPELKIGEGGGCMMFSAVEKTTRKTTINIRLASDVIQSMPISHKPTCSNTPVTAKIAASRKRGSERKSPFQLDSIAQSDRGR